jgi:hypothetical protein
MFVVVRLDREPLLFAYPVSQSEGNWQTALALKPSGLALPEGMFNIDTGVAKEFSQRGQRRLGFKWAHG